MAIQSPDREPIELNPVLAKEINRILENHSLEAPTYNPTLPQWAAVIGCVVGTTAFSLLAPDYSHSFAFQHLPAIMISTAAIGYMIGREF